MEDPRDSDMPTPEDVEEWLRKGAKEDKGQKSEDNKDLGPFEGIEGLKVVRPDWEAVERMAQKLRECLKSEEELGKTLVAYSKGRLPLSIQPEGFYVQFGVQPSLMIRGEDKTGIPGVELIEYEVNPFYPDEYLPKLGLWFKKPTDRENNVSYTFNRKHYHHAYDREALKRQDNEKVYKDEREELRDAILYLVLRDKEPEIEKKYPNRKTPLKGFEGSISEEDLSLMTGAFNTLKTNLTLLMESQK